MFHIPQVRLPMHDYESRAIFAASAPVLACLRGSGTTQLSILLQRQAAPVPLPAATPSQLLPTFALPSPPNCRQSVIRRVRQRAAARGHHFAQLELDLFRQACIT